ncbi:hypothetical protein TNIN_259491 [Trichonephila inaurata madagascariensis]|uniref:Uncharacterized protein n=1 Tax=Trichonephila inaurata madagascariensis TaxID=2747483 RepID=A0A8X7CP01_9ARAC|nr:hypothetical protein TNIN_259491 [Trichonephila inaurata madagascariensis]
MKGQSGTPPRKFRSHLDRSQLCKTLPTYHYTQVRRAVRRRREKVNQRKCMRSSSWKINSEKRIEPATCHKEISNNYAL